MYFFFLKKKVPVITITMLLRLTLLLSFIWYSFGFPYVVQSEASVTDVPGLVKRDKKIISPKYQKAQDQQLQSLGPVASPGLKPWIRTVQLSSKSVPEIVTPTVYGGVTFATKPPETTNGLEYWIDLKKDGSPKTMKPKNKGGHIKNKSPTYGTWFASPTTKTYSKGELNAHNMGDKFEEEIHIQQDEEYHALNPMIRCTPDRYFKKSLGRDKLSEPFCSPRDQQRWYLGRTYFVTWFTNFFKEANKVRLLMYFVKETQKQKGVGFKRSVEEDFEVNSLVSSPEINKRSSIIENGAKHERIPFFSSDWFEKRQGFFPVTVNQSWFGPNEYSRKILVTVQPDNLPSEDFNPLSNYLVEEIAIKSTVSKEHQVDLKKLEEKWYNQELNEEIEEGIDYEKYLTIVSVPCCVLIAAMGMYLFVYINKGKTDLSFLKNVRRGKLKKNLKLLRRKKNAYSELPQFSNEVNQKGD